MSEEPTVVEYPRDPPKQTEVIGDNIQAFGCGCLLLLVAPIFFCCAGGAMIAEGPHGPNGEIGPDPSMIWRIPVFGGGGLVLVVLAVVAFAYGFGWRPKR